MAKINKLPKNFYVYIAGIALLLVLIFAFSTMQGGVSSDELFNTNPQVRISDKVKYDVEVADTDAKRRQGLSGRESLGKNKGMLFIYDEPEVRSFWMFGMNFDLDFVWIRDNTIVDLDRNVSSAEGERTKLTTPDEPVDAVLEIPAGDIEQYGVEDGDEVFFENVSGR